MRLVSSIILSSIFSTIPLCLANQYDMCQMHLTELWTCQAEDKNLQAQFAIKGGWEDDYKIIYDSQSSTSPPWRHINDGNPFSAEIKGKQLKLVGEHVHDYVQFYYGDDLSWTTRTWWTSDADAWCMHLSKDWNRDGPDCGQEQYQVRSNLHFLTHLA